MKILLLLTTIFLPITAHAAIGDVPTDSKVINVKDYGAKGDGVTDDSDAIQQAFNKNPGSGSVIYLPKGTYLVSKRINWAGAKNRNVLQGQSESESIIRLKDSSPAFQNAERPTPMFHTGGAPAQRFQNGVRTLTIDVGNGNPGAVGLNFCANNTGAIRNVTIRSGTDGKSPGVSGLDLTESEVGPLLVQDLTVIGFDHGIRVGSTVNSITLDGIALRGQRIVGLKNNDNMVFAMGLKSENSVPAIVNTGGNGVVTLIDSELSGGASEQAALVNDTARGVFFVRNVKTSGYGQAIKDMDLGNVAAGLITEWCSDAPIALFPSDLKSLNLPIPETPQIPWEPVEDWVNVAKFGAIPGDGKDDTAALQAAIDSGASTLYLPAGREAPRDKRANNPGWQGSYVLSDTIHIRGKVQRIIGLDATINLGRAWPGKSPVFVFNDGDSPAVVVQQIVFGLGEKVSVPSFIHNSSRDLIISSFAGANYLRHEGKGRLFLEDVVGHEMFVGKGARLYAKQLNLEGSGMKLVNDGGQAWILGLKTEALGPIIETINGGTTEIIGAHLYTCVNGSQEKGGFFVKDSTFGLVGGGEYVWTRSWATNELFNVSRSGDTRILKKEATPRRHEGSMFAMLLETPTAQPTGPLPATPTVTEGDSTAGSIALVITANGSEAVGMEISSEGQVLAYTSDPIWRETRLAPSTSRTYQITSYDRFYRKSPPVEFSASSLPDTTPPSTPEGFRNPRVIDLFARLEWNATKDNIGVSGYEIQRKRDGKTDITTTIKTTSFTDEKVAPGAIYSYELTALDAAGNRSTPAILSVSVPKDPPAEEIIELERTSAAHKKGFRSKGGYAGDLHPGTWAIYKNKELGRTKPFTVATLKYACDNAREGGKLELFLNPTISKNAKGEPSFEGGTLLCTFDLKGTGGWEKWQHLSIPVSIPNPGKHTLGLRVQRADSKMGNALANIDLLTFSYE